MRHFIDHNVVAPAIADLGGVSTATDITNAPATASTAIEALRNIVVEALAGRATLVTSDTCLETLRRTLVRGGSDFEAIDEDSAVEAVMLLRVISRYSGGFVSDELVQAAKPVANTLLADHRGTVRGTIDHEDVVVAATLLASLSGADQDEMAVLVTNDQGLVNCGPALARRNVAVLKCERWMRATSA